MLRDGDVKIPVRISCDSKIVDGGVKGGLGLEFPVFLLRAVSNSCTVRDSEKQSAPRRPSRQPHRNLVLFYCFEYSYG